MPRAAATNSRRATSSESRRQGVFFWQFSRTLEKLPQGFYSTDYYTDKIIEYIDGTEKPSFAYLSFTAPHNPCENTLILVMSDNGPSKTTIAEYLELDGVGPKFLEHFDNQLNNRGLPGSNVVLGPGWAYGLAAPLRLMKGYQSQGVVLKSQKLDKPTQVEDSQSRRGENHLCRKR